MKNSFCVKIPATFLFCVVFSIGINAQNMFSKGEQNINLGIGIGTSLGGSDYTTIIPPLSVSYEKGVQDELFDDKSSLGIGAYLGIAGNRQQWNDKGNKYGYDYNYLIIGARGTVHYQLIDDLDTYGGLMIGLNIVSSKGYGNWSSVDGKAPATSGLVGTLFVGGRYYFKENMGAFAELGYGIAYLQLGITFKL